MTAAVRLLPGPDDRTDESAVIPSIAVERMLDQHAAVLAMVHTALATLREAKALAEAVNLGFPRLKLNENRYEVSHMLDQDQIADVEQKVRMAVDAGAWSFLMSESGLRTFMDAKARDEWDKGINKGEFPEFNAANVQATFTSLHDARGAMFERGVLAVFKRLSWDFKTNQPFKFGKRIIVRYLRGEVKGAGSGLGYINRQRTDELDDLVRVLAVLDGKPEPDHRHGIHAHMVTADGGLLERDRPRARNVETEYLHIRSFKNGHGHITFRRPDLVTQMNKILAKHYPGALAYQER